MSGKIVVNWDDWTLSDTGFALPNAPDIYVQNIASWFLDDSITTGSFVGYGSLFHLGGSMLRQAFESAGHTWVVSGDATFTLASLQNYDGVFIGASPLGDDIENLPNLTSYVAQGGNVYIYAGTDFFGSVASDAAVLNQFLNPYGLGVADVVDGTFGNISVNGSHEILEGVNALYGWHGFEIFDLEPVDARNEILALNTGMGIIAVYDPSMAPAPKVVQIRAISERVVDVTFDLPMGQGVTDADNYTVSDPGKGTLADHPDSATLEIGNTYRLTWISGSQTWGEDITITVATVVESAAGIPIEVPYNTATHLGGSVPVELSSFEFE